MAKSKSDPVTATCSSLPTSKAKPESNIRFRENYGSVADSGSVAGALGKDAFPPASNKTDSFVKGGGDKGDFAGKDSPARFKNTYGAGYSGD